MNVMNIQEIFEKLDLDKRIKINVVFNLFCHISTHN